MRSLPEVRFNMTSVTCQAVKAKLSSRADGAGGGAFALPACWDVLLDDTEASDFDVPQGHSASETTDSDSSFSEDEEESNSSSDEEEDEEDHYQ